MEHVSRSGETLVQRKIPIPLSFIIFFSVLNGMMFQIAVPDISAEYSLLPSEVSWVMTAYILVFALGSLVYGKLADIYSSKNLISIGLLLMNAGSLIGLFSMWYPMLIVARFMQAAGGAAIPALSMTIVTRYFPPDHRGRIFGIIASTVAFAAGVGPILGGFVSGTFHWRYLFLFPLATIFMIPCFRMLLPDETWQKHRFDTLGALLIVGGTALLLIFVTHGDNLSLPAGVIMLIWFAVHISRTKLPFVSPLLFLRQPYRNIVITTFFSIGTVFGMLFIVPIMLRDLNGLDANYIGLSIFPGAMTAALLGTLGGRLSDIKGSRFVFYIGTSLLISGFLLLSTFAGQNPLIITFNLVISYAGFAFLQSSLPHTVSSILPKEQTGIGMGIYNLIFFISGAFITASIGRLLDIKNLGFCINPLTSSVQAWIYSNIFVMLAVMIAVAAVIFHLTFRHGIKQIE